MQKACTPTFRFVLLLPPTTPLPPLCILLDSGLSWLNVSEGLIYVSVFHTTLVLLAHYRKISLPTPYSLSVLPMICKWHYVFKKIKHTTLQPILAVLIVTCTASVKYLLRLDIASLSLSSTSAAFSSVSWSLPRSYILHVSHLPPSPLYLLPRELSSKFILSATNVEVSWLWQNGSCLSNLV